MDQRKQGRLIQFISIVAVVALLAGTGRRVSAQGRQEIILTARVGLDGYCRRDAWLPVFVTLENAGDDVDGRVAARVLTSQGGTSSYGQDIQLPATSRKEMILYVHPGDNMSALELELTSRGEVLAGKKLRPVCLTGETTMIGVLSDNPSTYDELAAMRPLRGGVKTAQLRIEDLPDHPQGWEPLDVLIVARTDTGRLGAARRQALETWLAKGGRLLVVGGPQWQAAAAGLEGLLPVQPGSTRTVTGLPALGEHFQLPPPQGAAVLASGPIAGRAAVLVEQDGLPLVAEKPFGFGRVIFLAADPALQPLSNWDGMQQVYSQLLGPRPARPGWMDGMWNRYSADRAVSTLPHNPLPPSLAVCGWLILYVVVIGPLNFFITRRARRRELAWFTIPALVILFSGMAYAYGVIYRGPRPILNRLAVVQAWDGAATSEVRGMVGLYSPRRATYTLEAENPFMLSTFAVGEQNRTILQTGTGTSMTGVRVEIGGLQAASVQGSRPALEMTHTLVLTLNDKGAVLTGKLTNASQSVLRDAVLVTPGGQRKLGHLEPGGSRDVKIALGTVNNSLFYNSDPALTFGIDTGTGMNNRQDDDDIRRMELLNTVLYSEYGQIAANWGIYLMGWLDQPVLPVMIQGRVFDTIDTTLYVASLDPAVEIGPGPVRISSSLFAWESSDANISPYTVNEVPPDGYELRFRPAVPIGFSSVESLTLDLALSAYSSNITEMSVYLWDFRAGNWMEVVDLNPGPIVIPQPGRYVGPAGEIRLRIDARNSSNWVQVDQTLFTLVVNP